jgi:mono/diheme cytochrome c family protein
MSAFRRTAAPLLAAIAAAAGAAAQDEPALIERGRTLYEYWCATCHGPGIGNNGVQHLPGTDALRVKYRGALPALLTERTDMAPELVKTYVRQGITVMPFFRKTEIDDAELDAIAAYLTRNNPRGTR